MPRPRRSRRTVVATLLAAAALVAGTAVVLGATSQVDIKEANGKYAFTPASITVQVGDTVHWQNGSDAPHTVTSDTGTDLNGDIAADTGSYDKTFDTAGTWKYHCDIHDYMHGTIVVTEVGATAPPTQPPTDTQSSPGEGSGGSPYALLLVLAAAAGIGGTLALRRLTHVDGPRD
jgi:plastocyanin